MRPVPDDLFEHLVALRRDLHRQPELAWSEERTATRLEAELRALGLRPRRVCGTGVVADIPGRSEGPRIALRGDIDALPLTEATGLPFASERPGVMHACGHDGHATMVIGAAALLLEGGPPPVGVRLILQPAEEIVSGARTLVDAGVLEGVGAIFGGHLDNRYDAGTIVVQAGAVNASTDDFTIRVIGRGGHGGRPHETVDAVVVAAHVVVALQAVVAREIDPGRPAVISVGTVHAGSAPNVVAGVAELSGTIRAQDPAVRAQLREAVRRVAEGVAATHRAGVDVILREGTPAVINPASGAALARLAAARVVGDEGVQTLRSANMGGEDFAWYLHHVDGCYVRFGGRLATGASPPAHSPRFDFHEDALAYGAAWLATVARLAGGAGASA